MTELVGGNCWIIIIIIRELQQLNKKVDGVTKQTVPLIPSCCVSPKALTRDSFTDWAGQGEQSEISVKAQNEQQFNEKSAWSLSQQNHTVPLPVLFPVHFLMHIWTD